MNVSTDKQEHQGLTQAEQAFLDYSVGDSYGVSGMRPANLFILAYERGYNQALTDNGHEPRTIEKEVESFDDWYQRNRTSTPVRHRPGLVTRRQTGPRPFPAEPKVEDS